MSVDLRTDYLGLELRSPLVASPSPLTGELEGLVRLEGAGVGAVVLPSLFEEQLTHDQLELDRLLGTTADHTGEAQSYFPELANFAVRVDAAGADGLVQPGPGQPRPGHQR